jgi:hypothetical protein
LGIATFLGLVALLFFIWPRNKGKHAGPAGSAFAGSSVQVKAPASMEGSSDNGGGVFVEEKQAQQQPIITIGNETGDDLRLTMRDVNGIEQSAIIPAYKNHDFPVPEGDYDARIDAPDDRMLIGTTGTVRVKNFHHYDAEFVIVDSSQSQSFYIGD